MSKILSIQSHVCYGFVGNRAAVFPLQRLGHDVLVVNTVQFSNHTGYGSWKGDIMTHHHIQDIISGMKDVGALNKVNAVLSGYMGDSALGEIIFDTVEAVKDKRRVLYCLDPVIGDVGRGIFVKPEVAILMKEKCIEVADIITPNLYEINFLADTDIRNMSDLQKACDVLHQKGPDVILVTSVILEDTPKNHIQMYLSSTHGQFLISTPKFDMSTEPNGCGDATAAIFLARLMTEESHKVALEKTSSSIYEIFNATFLAGTRELQIISAQDAIAHPPNQFEAYQI